MRDVESKALKFSTNLVLAIQSLIDNEKTFVKEILMHFMKRTIDPSTKFDFFIDRLILLSIINSA
jgi:hypothetical protein